jgi:urease accessory protein
MLVADQYLGHRSDDDIAARLAESQPHRVALSDTERRRSRTRTETADGRDIGIVVSRDLGEGDVLETEGGELVVVELDAVDALVVDLAGAECSPADALAFGHAAGNRHWELALSGDEVLFPVPDTRERMLDAVEADLPEGAATRFERVPPTTFDEGEGHDGHSSGHHDHSHGGGDHAHGDGDHGGGPGHAHDTVRSAEDADR